MGRWKIEATLWQPTENEESNGCQAGNGSTHGTEGFSTQSEVAVSILCCAYRSRLRKDIDSVHEISGIILASLRRTKIL
jgi:hypothetical protein